MSELRASTNPFSSQASRSASPARLILWTALVLGVSLIGFGLYRDVGGSDATLSLASLTLLSVALGIALAFEFVNGFHDTANAAAMVIYTHSLAPGAAVVWSGIWNFFGVLLSTGAVAFGIVSLLPVELIVEAGHGAGLAMVFALLLAAILWNLATWYLGLPASSSHALIGAIIGVGLANQLMQGQDGVAGVDWPQLRTVGWSLLLSPLIGFTCAALLLGVSKGFIRNPELYRAPAGKPPPWWIRSLLIATCTGVSFAHGSNDGQKGMGLIMLILIGILPSAYALDRSMPAQDLAELAETASEAVNALKRLGDHSSDVEAARRTLADYPSSQEISSQVPGALSALASNIAQLVGATDSLGDLGAETRKSLRDDMTLISQTISALRENGKPPFAPEALDSLQRLKLQLDAATRFIPLWVKIAVAFALGLGTMVGWKRVVVTVGEKIGKRHLTYAQGGSAEVVAMATIFAADTGGLPVSTTHVLSSGVAGTMAAEGCGLQWQTVRNLAAAWVLTLPAAMTLSGVLYFLFTAGL